MTATLIIVPLLLLLFGLPIFVVLLATCAVVVVFFMDVPLMVLPQIMLGGVDKFTLLAIPFFIFAGEVMGQGGVSRRIVDWVLSIFAPFRSARAMTTVGACEFFGAVSGSSPATVASVGKLMYPSMREAGYDKKFSLGLITASGAIASVMPPSIMMVLYGSSAEQSISKLFAAGIVPGLMIGCAIAIYIVWKTRQAGIDNSQPFSLLRFLRITRSAGWALATPVVILGGIYSGIFSPTEAAGVAGVYGVVVTRFIYREITWKQIWDIALSSALLTCQILIIVAASAVFSWVLTISGIPQALVGEIAAMSAPLWVILLALTAFLLVVGCFMDPVSAIILFTPLLLPIVQNLGIDLVHFGVIMAVNLSIGMFTPPFGLNIFTTQAIFKADLSTINRGVLPFIGIQLIVLLIVVFFPDIALMSAFLVSN